MFSLPPSRPSEPLRPPTPAPVPPVVSAGAAAGPRSSGAGSEGNPEGDAGDEGQAAARAQAAVGSAGRAARAASGAPAAEAEGEPAASEGGEAAEQASRPARPSGPAVQLAPSLRALLAAMQAPSVAGSAAGSAAGTPAGLPGQGEAAQPAPPDPGHTPATAGTGSQQAAGMPKAGGLAQWLARLLPATGGPATAPPASATTAALASNPASLALAFASNGLLARAALAPLAELLFQKAAPRARSAAQVLAQLRALLGPGEQAKTPEADAGASEPEVALRALLAQLAQTPESQAPAFGKWRELLEFLRADFDSGAGEEIAENNAAGLTNLAEGLAAERLTQAARASQGQAWQLSWPWFDGQQWREVWVQVEPEQSSSEQDSGIARRASVGVALERLGSVRGDFWLFPGQMALRLSFEQPEALALARSAARELQGRLEKPQWSVRLEFSLDPERARAAAQGRGSVTEQALGWSA